MTWYLNQGGNHIGKDGRTTPHGGLVQDDLDLATLFPNKFQKVDPPAEMIAEIQAAAPAPVVAAAAPAAPTEVDVTDEFVGAKEAGFRVLQVYNKGKVAYNIFDGDSPVPSNEKPLTGPQTSKKLVELGVVPPTE